MRIADFGNKIPKGYLHCYGIYFNDGDSTELTAYDLADLEDLWADFCFENHLQVDCVDNVEICDHPVTVSFILTLENCVEYSDIERELVDNIYSTPGVLNISEVSFAED